MSALGQVVKEIVDGARATAEANRARKPLGHGINVTGLPYVKFQGTAHLVADEVHATVWDPDTATGDVDMWDFGNQVLPHGALGSNTGVFPAFGGVMGLAQIDFSIGAVPSGGAFEMGSWVNDAPKLVSMVFGGSPVYLSPFEPGRGFWVGAIPGTGAVTQDALVYATIWTLARFDDHRAGGAY